jgi:quinoprotein glucose dehydrogenase
VAGWSEVAGDKAGQRYSPLDQLTPENVGSLEIAWSYDSGDFSKTTSLQVTPVLFEDSLVFCTPLNRVVALDAESGEERWQYDPKVDTTGIYNPICRGVSLARASETSGKDGGVCRDRVVFGTIDARLIALDVRTGRLCESFGQGGTVNLLDGIGETRTAEYYMTSPPLVVGDRVVTGAWVTDGQRVDSPGGVIRAFDVGTGELIWAWDPVPPDWDPVTAEEARQGEIYTRGTPNTWGLLSADEERGLLFAPMGNASPDHYGGERNGLDYYSTAVVALDVETGELKWSFRTVNHDVWDYDVASQPVLYTHPGQTPRPALAQATKMGHIFLLDRETGEPIFPVEERPVPQEGGMPGEMLAATQPFPTRPAPLHPHTLAPEDVWGLTPIDRADCRKRVAALRNDGIFTPPSYEGSLVFPGLGGGVNWGSVSIDPERSHLVVNSMRNPFIVQLVPRDEATSLDGTDLVGAQPQEGTPYVTIRAPLLSSWGMPCTPPPWGLLTSIDLETGEKRWEVPLGTLEELAPAFGSFFNWGTPNTGGPIQTAGGLIFIGATMDNAIRAFDADSGEELWKARLPFSAHATPMTYRLGPDRRQFVVIAAGGHAGLGSPSGDALVAFALPD